MRVPRGDTLMTMYIDLSNRIRLIQLDTNERRDSVNMFQATYLLDRCLHLTQREKNNGEPKSYQEKKDNDILYSELKTQYKKFYDALCKEKISEKVEIVSPDHYVGRSTCSF